MKRRILLVDDELAILLTLKTILEIHQFEVETAISAKEAIAKLNANTYHMVITDMKMEHENAGYDVIREAKNTGRPCVGLNGTVVSRWQPEQTALVSTLW